MTLAPNRDVDAVDSPSGSNDFVAVLFARDQREAEKYRQFLARHDVPVTVGRAAVLDHASDIALLVPAEKLERASDLIAASDGLGDTSYTAEFDLKDGPFDDDDEEETEDDDFGDDEDDDEDDMDDEFYDDDDDDFDDDDDDAEEDFD